MISNKRHFLYNLTSNYVNTFLSVVLNFVSVPIALNYWGSQVYGVWIILMSFSTYISASGLGIDAATGILMTKNTSYKAKISILKKGITLLVIGAFISGSIIALLTILFPNWIKIVGKMDESNYPTVKISALIFIAGIIMNLPFSAIANSLQSFGKAYLNTIISTFQTILNFMSILITVSLRLSLPMYVLIYSSGIIFCGIIKFLIVLYCIKKIKYEEIESNEIDSVDNHYKMILKTGINMSLVGLAILLVPNLSNLIISNSISVDALVAYSMSYKLYSTIILFVTNMNISLTPLLGIEYGKNNWEWLNTSYKKMFYTTVSLSIFLILSVLWLSKPFITIWTGNINNYSGTLISVFLAAYFFIYCLSNINLCIINSFNYTNKVWLISWCDGLVFLLSAIILVKNVGIIGVPLGLYSGIVLVSSWAYPLVIYKRTNKRFSYDFKYLVKYVIIFIVSIICFGIISKLNLSFVKETILLLLGMIVTTIVIVYCLPKEIIERIKQKINRKKVREEK